MTSDEHKREAKRLLAESERPNAMYVELSLRRAQVHATLANVPDPKPHSVGYE